VPADLSVRTDPAVLAVVFENLIENAVEHNDADAPVVTVRSVDVDDGTVAVEVEDNGPGVPDHELDVLDATEETALEHGSGLGLWIVKWGVASLGGTVAFDISDTGTTARVSLPAAEADEDIPERDNP
jgi:signal transduction histidine kinase